MVPELYTEHDRLPSGFQNANHGGTDRLVDQKQAFTSPVNLSECFSNRISRPDPACQLLLPWV
jgi:hypothetical protein